MSRQTILTGSDQYIKVAAGILLDATDRVLIADRARAPVLNDFWEFPGGKLRTGESAENALRRELIEELGISVISAKHFISISHDYPDKSVFIEFFIVDKWSGVPVGKEGQSLSWVDKSALGNSRLLPADRPVIEALQSG